jgi:hypothetical protein
LTKVSDVTSSLLVNSSISYQHYTHYRHIKHLYFTRY